MSVTASGCRCSAGRPVSVDTVTVSFTHLVLLFQNLVYVDLAGVRSLTQGLILKADLMSLSQGYKY